MPSQSHTVLRVEIRTGIPYDEFVTALEKAAPPVDSWAYELIEETGGTWDDVRAAMAENAPHHLVRYFRLNATQLFRTAGHSVRSVEYLIGDHVLAESMFRHDPRAILYAPLRMLVHTDDDGNAVFTMHRPSDEFGSLGVPEVTKVGEDLDRHVIELLRVCGVDASKDFA
ncbi:hypothetical protein OHB41_43730 [Streptomyces sp. NBC_01571]|uniref:DUF302 domain-containing protein n=1 Tax=Streptomyces sp. NBC_01571 TaxID=2975883 RepID=UPI00225B1521|nr:DUF302 domain-containing protein [Streptomyces sp. NBC_01571]MCX4579962.1 hypothetical protein [Streptomyces sp. NBC_01571]